MFDSAELIKGIQESTGYVWKIEELSSGEMEDEGITTENIELNRGIKPDKLKVIGFYRNSRSRSELWLLRLVLMPGCAFLKWDAGRAAGSTEIHNSVKELLDEIKGL